MQKIEKFTGMKKEDVIKGITFVALKVLNGKAYYFDTDNICHAANKSMAAEMNLINLEYEKVTKTIHIKRNYKMFSNRQNYDNIIEKATVRLQEGDTLDDFADYLMYAEWLERKVKSKIYGPEFITDVQKSFNLDVITGNLINVILRVNNRKIYYFDDSGIYRCITEEEATKIPFPNMKISSYGEVYFSKEGYFFLTKTLKGANFTIVLKSITALKPGQNLKDFENLIKTTKIKKRILPDGLDRFITKIEKPVIITSPESPKNAFDFIYVDVNIVVSWDNKKEYIEKNLKEIDNRVIEKIETDTAFLKYGIPVNFLKICRRTLANEGRYIQYVFGLKDF